MCVALLGGIDRLKPHYKNEAVRAGIELKLIPRCEHGMRAKIRNVDAVIIFTNKISHGAKKNASAAAGKSNVPVFMHHSCGVCSLRKCLACIKQKNKEEKLNN